MPELKPGWRRVKFGEVVRQVKDRVDPESSGLTRYVAGEHMETDDLRIRRWGDIGEGYLGPAFHMRFRPGQVLYGSRRTYLRKVAVADFDAVCSGDIYVFDSANPARLLPELLPFVMQTEAFHEHSKRESKGSVNPYVNFSDLAWYEFALPPLEEQRQLSRLLRAAVAFVEAQEEVVNRAESVRIAQYEASIESVSITFPVTPLPDLCELLTVGIVVTPAKYYVAANGVPVLRSLNVWPGRFDLNDIKELSAEGHHLHLKSEMRTGDVVIVRTGDPGRPGNAAVVPPEMNGWNCVDIILARPGPSILPEFFALFLNWSRCTRQMQGLAPGTKQKHLSISSLHRIGVPVPPVEVQHSVVEQQQSLRTAEQRAKDRLLQARDLYLTASRELGMAT